MGDAKTLSPEIFLHIAKVLKPPPFPYRCHWAAQRRWYSSIHCAISQRGHGKPRRGADPQYRREARLFSGSREPPRDDPRVHRRARQAYRRIEGPHRGHFDKSELEDLYSPYRPKRRTKATIARDRGLEPLADYLWAQQSTDQFLAAYAATFIDLEHEVASVEDALEGARHIVAETISESADLRKALRQMMFDEGIIVSKKSSDAVDAAEQVQDVLRLSRAGEDHPIAP